MEDLLQQDWKRVEAARQEAARLGARVVPELLAARAAGPPLASRRQPLDEALRGVVGVLRTELARPLQLPLQRHAALGVLGGLSGLIDPEPSEGAVPRLSLEELGDAGSITAREPVDAQGQRQRARLARAALVLLGPGVTGLMLEVPPVPEPALAQAQARLLARIYADERALAQGAAGDGQDFLARYRGLADLATPVLELGVRDPDPRVRALFQRIRDEAVDAALGALGAPDADRRGAGEQAALRLGELGRPALTALAEGRSEGATVQEREAAARLARYVRFGLSPELVRRLGQDLAGYDALDFRERRALVLALERLGGALAVPALRALLREEPSDEVRTVAAIGLFRLGDQVGAEWLALHRQDVPLVRLSPRELAAIFMDQGLRYLQLGRFERAEREFKQVLELEPENEVAWYNLACTYSRWGKVDEALEHLRRAVACGFDDVSHMNKDPDLENIRTDPRFREIIAGIEADRSAR